MGRRRDQRHARRGKSCLGHPGIHFFARKVSALARLCALRHLDLDLFRAAQILAGDAESSRSHLFDLAVLLRPEALSELSTLAGVGARSDGIHRKRQRLMRLGGKGAVTHGPGLEVFDDIVGGLHLIKGNGVARRHEFQKAAESVRPSRVVHKVRISPESFVGVLPHRSLQRDDGLRAVHVVFLVPSAPKVMKTDRIQRLVHAQSKRVKSVVVTECHAFLNLPNADSAHTAHCSGKISINYILPQPDRLENTGGLIGLQGGNAHLGRYFDDAV